MAKTNLASMSVESLLKLRDDIGAVLSRKADELKQQLSQLSVGGEGAARRGRKPSMKGAGVPKYRSPEGETWVGRGARPRWLSSALKEGKTLDDFLIQPTGARKAGRKPGRRKAR